MRIVGGFPAGSGDRIVGGEDDQHDTVGGGDGETVDAAGEGGEDRRIGAVAIVNGDNVITLLSVEVGEGKGD